MEKYLEYSSRIIDLVDIKLASLLATWTNKRVGDNYIGKRLD